MPLNVPGFFGVLPTFQVRGQGSGEAQTGDNVFLEGANAGDLNSGDDGLAIGRQAAENNSGATFIAIGPLAGRDNTGDNIVALGDAALDQNVGVGAIGIGFNAGLNNASDGLIAIGLRAADAGLLAGDVTGMIAIGTDAAGMVSQTNSAGQIVVVGALAFDANPGAGFVLGVTVIGGDALGAHSSGNIQGPTVVGADAASSITDNGNDLCVMGRNAGHAGVLTTGNNNTTAFGARCLEDVQTGQDNCAVGKQALTNITVAGFNTVMGNNAGENSQGIGNVIIGQGAATTAGDANVYLGRGSGFANGGEQNVMIGADGIAPSGSRNIILGHGHHISATWVANSDVFAVETRDGAIEPTLGCLYGRLDLGSVIVGMNIDGNEDPIDRDLSGTNVLKILDGTAPSANPTGGGFLFVTAGALNYRGSGGTVTPLAAA